MSVENCSNTHNFSKFKSLGIPFISLMLISCSTLQETFEEKGPQVYDIEDLYIGREAIEFKFSQSTPRFRILIDSSESRHADVFTKSGNRIKIHTTYETPQPCITITEIALLNFPARGEQLNPGQCFSNVTRDKFLRLSGEKEKLERELERIRSEIQSVSKPDNSDVCRRIQDRNAAGLPAYCSDPNELEKQRFSCLASSVSNLCKITATQSVELNANEKRMLTLGCHEAANRMVGKETTVDTRGRALIKSEIFSYLGVNNFWKTIYAAAEDASCIGKINYECAPVTNDCSEYKAYEIRIRQLIARQVELNSQLETTSYSLSEQ